MLEEPSIQVAGRHQEHDKPPKKRRKTAPTLGPSLLGPGYERYDATGLVPHYTHTKEVPNSLKKYFSQRKRLFSLYDEGCLLDEEGWYSVTPERIALQIAERCRCETVLDAFCGVGGNAIAFAQTCERVIAIDNSPTRLALARHNACIYGVQDRIEFILGDFPNFARSLQSIAQYPDSSLSETTANSKRFPKIDIVFLSPPWGGPSYLAGTSPAGLQPNTIISSSSTQEHPQFTLEMTAPLPGDELFKLARSISPHVAYYLPRNTDIYQLAALVDDKSEKIEVEEEWMGAKLKALTCYFGGLAKGQEAMWV